MIQHRHLTKNIFKKRKLINGHFRPGLCLLHSRNNDFQKV